MKIKQIEHDDMDQIEALWIELKQHHSERTINYTQHYLETTFSKCKAELLAKEQVAIFVVEINGNSNTGKLLMGAGMEWLNRHHLEKIKLLVGQGNEGVLSFYEKLGFRTRATIMEFQK